MGDGVADNIRRRLLQQGHISPAGTASLNFCLEVLLLIRCAPLPFAAARLDKLAHINIGECQAKVIAIKMDPPIG